MATSRGGMPADPTLSATTDDNARGGLFARSNVGNIVQGVDVSSISVNDSTITITIGTESQSFTLNQATDSTLTFTAQSGGGGGQTTPTDAFDAVAFDTTNTDELVFTRADGSNPVRIDLSRFDDATAIANAIQAANIPRNFTDLGQTPSTITTGNAGQYLTANPAGDALIWDDLPPNTLDPNSFESTGMTVAASNGSVSGRVNLESRMLLGNGTTASSSTNPAISLVVDPATGYRVEQIASTGVYVLERIEEAGEPQESVSMRETTALTESPEITFTVTPNGGTFVMDSDVAGTVTDPDGNPVTTAMIERQSDGMSATAVIPMGDADAPGTYTATFTTTTTTPDGTRGMPETTSATTVRFIPFFQSRTQISDVTASGVTGSTAAWNGSLVAIPGTGTVYFAVLASELASTIIQADQNTFPARVGHVGTLTITLADSTTRTFNQFRVQGAAGSTIDNFR